MDKCGGGEGRPPAEIFILSGQSNMCGRGGVHDKVWDHVVPPECSPHPSILRFAGGSEWVEAREPLHADVDVHKTCGVGPGMAFANALLGQVPSIGLVPCAIGGTPISEWARGEKPYEQMLARARLALRGGGALKAVLWYQGESDTTSRACADAYSGRLERLISDVRSDLGTPQLPFLQVALASGVEEELLDVVRRAQMAVDLPNVVCVDAIALPLGADRMHLTTAAQVSLGKMLADAYAAHFLLPSRRRL